MDRVVFLMEWQVVKQNSKKTCYIADCGHAEDKGFNSSSESSRGLLKDPF